MADLFAIFRKNVNVVTEDDRQATVALVRRLKQLTPQELLQRGPDVWSRLSMSQYRDVIETIAPDVHIPDPPEVTVEPMSISEAIGRWWRARTILMQSTYLTIIATSILVPLMIAVWPTVVWTLEPYILVRNVDPRLWPPCGRLAWNTDGCVYVSTQDLTWEWLSYHLAITAEDLLRTNKHLPVAFIPAASQVTIWRSRGQLKWNKQ
jgi:hypothetical protein